MDWTLLVSGLNLARTVTTGSVSCQLQFALRVCSTDSAFLTTRSLSEAACLDSHLLGVLLNRSLCNGSSFEALIAADIVPDRDRGW